MEEWKDYKESPWGYIPKHWEVCSIKDETEVVTDYVANGSFASLAENVQYKSEKDYAVLIRLVDYNNQFKGDFVYIDKDAYEFLGKSKLYGDEIIISNVGANVGTVFKCPHLEYKMSLAPNSIMVKFKGNNDFYYYWLKSRFGQHMLQSIVTGSAQPKFNKTNFKDLLIPVPPLREQESIACVLKSLDDKIEVNRRINENLEQQAQALFKSWFVDFEPFKDNEFVESEMGMIPKGWRVGKLGEFVKTTSGGTPSRKVNDYYNGNINWVKSKELKNSFIAETEEKITDEAIKNSSAKLLPTHSVLIAMYGATVGEFGIITQPMTCNQAVCALLPSNNVPYSILYMFARNNKNALQSKAIGSAQQNISQVIIKEMSFVFNEKVFSDFNCIVEPMLRQIENNFLESRRLATLRDTLLPKLMSGELKVNEVIRESEEILGNPRRL